MKNVVLKIKKPLSLPGVPSNEAYVFFTYDKHGHSSLNLQLKCNKDFTWCENFKRLQSVVIRE